VRAQSFGRGIAALAFVVTALVATRIGQAADDQTLVVVNKYGDTVTFFNTKTNARIATIPVPAHPHEIIVAPDGRTAYVSIYGDGIYGRNTNPGHTIEILDLHERTKTGEIDLGEFRGPHQMAFDPSGRLWVTCDSSSAVVIVDTKQRKVVGSVPTSTTGNHWLVMLPDGTKAYTSNKDTTHMSVIDVKSMKMIGTIPMPNGSDGVTVSANGQRLYVADLKQPMIHVIDTGTDTETWTVALKARPQRVRLTADEKYLVGSASGAAVVVDVATLTERGSISIGKAPMGIAFPGKGHTAYVTNHDDGTISLVDPDTMKVITTFPTDAGPETMVVYPVPSR
jgi:YVTN family beta-propeller protein